MSVVTCKIKIIENIFITLPDGCRLAAKIWMPCNALKHPVPAILEYLPYRKCDGTAIRDQLTHPYFAEHGFCCVRVDMRGSGESDGVLLDEYLEQEQRDCLEVLRWLAKQAWCTGKVGMMGISWGGFNSLQVAARRPPELHAIISLCSTDDRYADDIHFMGGCLLNDNFQWSTVMLAMMSRAPNKAFSGEQWRDVWLNRLNHQPFLAATWLQHQHRDAYWQHGSICEDWSAITCPVYLIGGWADGYSNTIPRMLANLQCPRKGLVGPWAHQYPHFAKPGPQIGFLQEALRWWNKWLKGIETGIMDEPMYRVWMQESVSPQPFYEYRPGRWVSEKKWPSQFIQNEDLFLNGDGKLTSSPTLEGIIQGCSSQSVGESAGAWCGYGLGPEKPLDQRVDDVRSICFDTEPLVERLEILGAPIVELNISVDRPIAFVAVRLNEVSPNGSSTRISYGILNLAHSQNHEKITPVVPGERLSVSVKLNDIAHAFTIGNKLRIAISTTYWPLVWPSPCVVTLNVFTDNSKLILPVRAPRDEDNMLPAFEKAEGGPPLAVTYLRSATGSRRMERNLDDGTVSYYVEEDMGQVIFDDSNLNVDWITKENYQINEQDPLSATLYIHTTISLSRDDWQTRTEIQSRMQANKTHYLISANLYAYEGDSLIFSREWQESIPRDVGNVIKIESHAH
jgi:putative CocE/NonD family hydrolase